MANELSSNVSTRVAKVIMDSFEANRVLTKTVNTSLVSGANGVNNETGDTVYLKRPTQFRAIETSDGDISAETKNDIGVGRIPATVQPYITIPINYSNLEEVTELNQLKEILSPAAEELATRLELNLGKKMIENAGPSFGTIGNAWTKTNAWESVAGTGALLKAIGMPNAGEKYYVANDLVGVKFSAAQNSLTAADGLVRTAWQNAQIADSYAGLRVLTSSGLNTYEAGATADRAGTLASNPDVTWVTHKDTMIQTLNLTGLTVSTVDAVLPGDVIEYDAIYHVNVATRKPVIDATGASVKYRCTVVTGGDTDGSGNVTVTVTNSAIFGATGLDSQYTNVSAAPVSGSVFNILGAAGSIYQPSLCYHKNAFALATLKLPKLHATDTIAKSMDGLSMRITKYSDGDKNAQRWRIDMLPVMGVMNQLFMAKGFPE
jgi:hypothetical protein